MSKPITRLDLIGMVSSAISATEQSSKLASCLAKISQTLEEQDRDPTENESLGIEECYEAARCKWQRLVEAARRT